MTTHMLMYTIYTHTSDYPDAAFVVKAVTVTGEEAIVSELVGTADDLESARALVPWQADACIHRSEDDDPVIVETWV